ncbi:unnamed protein product [Peronospora farinosa]|uniref:Crinkler effector protein N-terminal domain-containing protein n=1 Tax=Peronospora farinosa TaxID=134698 RepID=A0AAV0U9H4_9STRA|nr:unnamed protein product [Peronospora farinosa]CAI5733018.1 unnamed protein product [Peronospora farinosa]
MVKLFCVIVGVKGSAFPVNIDTTKSVCVGDLKDAITAKNASALKNVDADQLRLLLAKETDGEWLSSGLKIVKKQKKGEKTAYIEALTAEENELQADHFLEVIFVKKNSPTAWLHPRTDQAT